MNKTQKEKHNSQKKELFKILRTSILSIVIGFTAMLLIKSFSTIMNVQTKAWNEAKIPYDVKNEWVLNNILSTTRFRTSFGNDGGFIANILQKTHYKVYLSAKSKIPDDDPFWIEFWEPATYIGKTDYSVEKHNELLKKLNLISSFKSLVESFNNYNSYFFVDEILDRLKHNTYYNNSQEEVQAYTQALKASYPIIDKFTQSNFNFYSSSNNKYYEYIYNIPENFITNVLVTYMRVIKKEKIKTCDNDLYKNVFQKILNLIKTKNKISLLIQNQNDLISLEYDLNNMIKIYNKQYKEHCINK